MGLAVGGRNQIPVNNLSVEKNLFFPGFDALESIC
jgi:hypothetical protein